MLIGPNSVDININSSLTVKVRTDVCYTAVLVSSELCVTRERTDRLKKSIGSRRNLLFTRTSLVMLNFLKFLLYEYFGRPPLAGKPVVAPRNVGSFLSLPFLGRRAKRAKKKIATRATVP